MDKKIVQKKVKDLSYASLLKSQGYKLDDVLWEGKTAWFVFKDDGKAEEKLRSFINGDLRGNLKNFDDSMKTLKQMLFSHKTKENYSHN